MSGIVEEPVEKLECRLSDGRLKRGDFERRCEGGALMNKTSRVALRKCAQAEEVEVSSGKEMTGVRRTRPAGKAKERETEKRRTRKQRRSW